MLFFLVILCLAKYLKDNSNIFAWLLFCILSTLGFYTIPIMIYPFGIIIVWVLLSILFKDIKISRKILLKNLVIAVFVIIIFTAILYSPVFIRTGLKTAIAANIYGTRSWHEFISTYLKLIKISWQEWNRNIPILLNIFFVFAFIISLIFHKRIAAYKITLIAAIIIWCLPLIFLLQKDTKLFTRHWLFLLPIYIILTSSGIFYIINFVLSKVKINKSLLFAVISFCLAVGLCVSVYTSKSLIYPPSEGSFTEYNFNDVYTYKKK